MNLSTNTVASLFGATSMALALCVISPVASPGLILADDGIVNIERSPSPLGTTPVADPAGNPIGLINYNGG